MPRATAADVQRAVDVLRRGGLVAFPTETVYGLGADASNARAVRRVFDVKERPRGHPLIVHLADGHQLDTWASDVPDVARALADAFWPGPLTLLVHRRPNRVVDAVTGGHERVGLRVPAHPLALELLESFGGGIAAPSANRFGRVSPTSAAHVRADLGTDVDCVLDGGSTEVGVESTIVDCTTREPEVVRPGGVTLEALEQVVGRPVGLWLGDRELAAPGTLATHYAPKAAVWIVERPELVAAQALVALSEGRTVAVLAPRPLDDLPPAVLQLSPAGSDEQYAHVLYSRLREADDLQVNVLIVVPPSDRGVGLAVRDRLRRAATREH